MRRPALASETGAPPRSPETPALALEGVTKWYGDTPAARDLGLEVTPGEHLAVVGPSGCGKSTLLRLVAGLERPDAGTIRIAGDLVSGARTWKAPERRHVGMLFQDHALFPHLDVTGNVAFGLDRLPRADRARRVREVLDLVRLGHLAGRYPHELSGGEQQRVALARALAPRPAVVLLDEPFSSLDESLRAQVRADIVTVLRRTRTTAVLVTHDQSEALAVGDRVAVLRDGGIEQAGRPQDVFESPASRFVASFIGDADFLPAQIDGERVVCEIGPLASTPEDPTGSRDGGLDAVLRPHEVTLTADPDAPARVSAVEYRGAFVVCTVTLPSGRTVRSWRPAAERLAVGTGVTVAATSGSTPTLLPREDQVTPAGSLLREDPNA